MVRRHRIAPEESRAALARIEESPALSAAVEEACRLVVASHPEDLTDERIWAAVIDTTDPAHPRLGHFRGDGLVYPASVIKVVYMAHAYEQVASGQRRLDRRLKKLLREMIRVSSNRATQDILDLLTGVTDGPRIEEPAAYRDWVHRRTATNRYLRSLGLVRSNACQKTWDELPAADSREMQFLGAEHPMGYVNGNRLTAIETAQLLWLIDQDLLVSPAACRAMRDLLERDAARDGYGDRQQSIGRSMPPGTRIWSKGGSTDRWFADAAIVETPGGRRLVMVVFTDMPHRPGLDRVAVLDEWAQAVLRGLD